MFVHVFVLTQSYLHALAQNPCLGGREIYNFAGPFLVQVYRYVYENVVKEVIINSWLYCIHNNF